MTTCDKSNYGVVVEHGKCSICGKEVDFKIKENNSLREAFCPICKGSKRNRDLAEAILKTFGKKEELSLEEAFHSLKHLAIFEAQGSGPIHQVLCQLPHYSCSEYFDDISAGITNREGVRCENIEKLTFPNNSFDLVITQDVLEHVRNPGEAFLEINRVLKPGGFHIFTVPIHEGRPTVKRVMDKDGGAVFPLPPVHHGDPLRGDGSLVCTDFGEDLIDYLKSINLPTEIVSCNRFYNIEQIPHLSEERVYKKYLEYKDKRDLLSILLYNSIVFRSKKEIGDTALTWTGERFVPWVEDPIIAYEHLHRYAFAKEFVHGKKVVDLACGEGYGSVILAEVAASVTGIDIDNLTIQHASQKYRKTNLKFIKGSITDVPIKGQEIFDVAVCFEALEHLTDHTRLLNEAKRLLKKDGALIISTPNKKIYTDEAKYQNPFHIKELYFDEFKKQLSDLFQNVVFFGQKVFPSSNIFPLWGDQISSKSFAIEKREDAFAFVSPEQKPARYFIAVAKDHRSAEDSLPGESYLVDLSDSCTISSTATRHLVPPRLENPGQMYRKVQELICQGKEEEAIQGLEKIIAQFPQVGLAHNDLAVLVLGKGEMEKALGHYEKAVELEPENITFKKNLSEFYFVVRKETTKAVRILLEILKKHPADVETLNMLGDICARSERQEEAESFFRRATEIDPSNEAARNFLLTIGKKKNSGKEALPSQGKESGVGLKEKKGDGTPFNRMKEDWNRRAREDVRYYIHSTCRGQTEEEFDRSGKDSVEKLIMKDLEVILSGKSGPDMRVLEIGCGIGRMTKYLAEIFGEVHGVDVSGEMIRVAKERLGHLKNAFFYEGSGWDLSMFPNEFFDFAFSFIVFQHIPDKAVVLNYIREACRVLKTTGVFKFQVQGCTDPQWLQVKKNTWQGETVTEADIRSISRELGFEILDMEGQGTQYSYYILRKREMGKIDFQRTSPTRLLPKRCSIVIPVFNKVEYTTKCIEAIRRNTPTELYELVIVDNASTDGTKNFLSQLKESIRIIFNSANVGFTQACNQGAREASGEFVLFLNNDTEPQPGWLDALLETMQGYPEAGIVGSKLIYPDGRLQEAGGIIFRDGTGWNYGRFDSPEHPRYNYVREVDYVSGASLLIRRLLLETLGFFDEQYSPGYYEDTDICFGVRSVGYKVLYSPFSAVIHHEGISSGTDLAKGMKQYQVRNRERFVKKWENALKQQPPLDSSNIAPASERNVSDNILVIDPFLPMFDRASGSLRLFSVVKILRELKYHVTFIARNGAGQERYIDILRKMGVEVYATDPTVLRMMGYKVDAPKIDLKKILAERFYRFAYLSFFPIAEQYLPAVRTFSPQTIILVDSVDIHFLREKRMAERKKDPKLLERAEIIKRNELFAYRMADAVVTVTEEDWKSVAGELEGKINYVIPNIHLVDDKPIEIENRTGLLFVGNFSHPPNEDGVRFFIETIFPLVKNDLPNLQVTIVGNNPTPYVQGLQGADIKITGYVPSTEPYLRNARVSVAPLTFGAGMKGKIGEAMAHGLPVVTTSIGAEGIGLATGENAIIADTPEEFASGIIKLCRDDVLWMKMAREGKEFIRGNYSYPAVREIIQKILEDGKKIHPQGLSAGELRRFRERNFLQTDKVSGLVSIIILTWNQLEYTKACLASIRNNTPESHEIIFVDNGSTDGTVKWLRKLVRANPQYILIENKSNLGFAKGCNQGIKASKGEFLLLLNNDVLVTPKWLAGMLETLCQKPDIGIVGPMTNQISGIQKVPGVPYKSVDRLDEFAFSFRERNRHRRIPARRIVGFCMLFRRELVDRIGFLDENFGTGNFEDDDFCLRAELEGYSNMIAGDVFIHHHGSRSFIGNQIDYRSSMSGNKKIFFEKWNGIDYKLPLGRKLLSLQEKEGAWKLYHQDQIEKSAEKFLTALKISPQDEDIYLSFSEMCIDAKRYQEAFDLLKQMPQEKENALKYALMGFCQENLGKILEADELAEKALSLDPGNHFALNLKGILAYRRGKMQKATGFFQKAIHAASGYGEPYTNLGVMKWEAGEKEEALDWMERGFILSPTSTDNLQLYHSAVSELGAFERAEKSFLEAEALYPSHKKIQYLLMDVLLRQGKNEAAMERIEKAIAEFGMDEGMMKAALEVRKKIGPKEIPERMERRAISLCMIVKNEQEHLARCLQTVKTIVDEMIVVDTGSLDRTKELATIFGAKVFDFVWVNDFSSARNYSLSKASGDWIFVLDGDETISPGDYPVIRELTSKMRKPPLAYSFVTRNYVTGVDYVKWTPNDGSYGEEKGSGWFPSEKVRLFPRTPHTCFENPVHEFVEPTLIRHRISILKCPVPIHHFGKLDEEKTLRKGEEYFALGKLKLEEKGSDLQSLKEFAIQAGNLGRHEEAVDLWHRIIHLFPQFTEAYINLSSNFIKLNQYGNAADASKRAIELDPSSKEAMINYALSQYFLGNFQEMKSNLEPLAADESVNPLALGLLSMGYILNGEKEKYLPLVPKIKNMGYDFNEYLEKSAKELISCGQEEAAKLLLDFVDDNSLPTRKKSRVTAAPI